MGVASFIAILPYVLTLQAEQLALLPIPIPVALLLSGIQSSVLLAITIFIGLFLGKKIGLGAPLLTDISEGRATLKKFKPIASLSVGLGLVTGFAIVVFDYFFSFFITPFKTIDITLWKRFFAAFYGGIFEEVLLRLFLVTLIAWILSKLFYKKVEKPTPVVFWMAIIVAAILFGLGHLPATALLTTITPIVIVRAIVLNGIGGVVFGWLYWRKGLLSAMMAHFTADIVLLVIVPLYTALR